MAKKFACKECVWYWKNGWEDLPICHKPDDVCVLEEEERHREEAHRELDDYFTDEDEAYETYFDTVKADVAYCLGIEECSDEWYALMDI